MKSNDVNIIEFNLCGQICPSTLLVALREINKNSASLSNGEIKLLFKTDNRDSINTIPETSRNMGFRVEVEKRGAQYEILVSNI
ncbi:MAG: sulfurtransferase TusA family protein [Desulfuromonadaceae bacterium]|nr:sulfurtransferase TusA family protein [Desulfuromonadaceae bacterium]MDD2855447.1 sulfurtransferase TusA family protein [Desulfuromonadaceae bacterium]